MRAMNENLAAAMPWQDMDDSEETAGPILADMVKRWERGDRPTALDYLAETPELADRSEVVLRLIYEEICLRQEYGEELTEAQLLGQFPRWRKDIQALLQCHQLLVSTAVEPTSVFKPNLSDYTLVAELGRGGQGCVYLARQESLDDRPVVLKISPRRGFEHLTLARLQHTGIVPLFSAEDDPEENVRVLCMPFFGGATLGTLFVQLRTIPIEERRGSDLLAALDRLNAALPIQTPARGPARKFLAGASYVQGVCWIGSCLAEALQFAHERGYIHLDIKPANILVTADGQPMLLDFHIAQQKLERGSKAPLGFGGTPIYMSPEQWAAVQASDVGQAVPEAVDVRSDLFSLGLVLYEALGGRLPQDPRQCTQPTDISSLPVSTGLRDILARCLAAKPAERYPSAATLAEDLRRQAQDLPLKGVRNRSLAERWRKWRRRRPAAFPLLAMVAAVLMAGLALLLFTVRHEHDLGQQAEQALAEGKQHFQLRRYAEALTAFQRGVELTEQATQGTLGPELRTELDKARRAHLAEKLHDLADTFRFYGADPDLHGNIKSLKGQWLTVWAQRTELTGLDAEQQDRLNADFLDLALVWVELRVRLADSQDKHVARQEALKLLKEAETAFGPSPVIDYQRQALGNGVNAVNRQAGQQVLTPRTPWEHYALGRAHMQQGQWERAAELLHRATELDPRGFWPYFYQGLCAMERRDYADAESAFRVCVALAPQAAACHFNRALALAKLSRRSQAIAAFSQALANDTRFAPAAYQRGLLYLEAKRYEEAAKDFDHALNCGYSPAPVYHRLALVQQAQGNRAAALAAVQHALEADPQSKEARQLLQELEAQ